MEIKNVPTPHNKRSTCAPLFVMYASHWYHLESQRFYSWSCSLVTTIAGPKKNWISTTVDILNLWCARRPFYKLWTSWHGLQNDTCLEISCRLKIVRNCIQCTCNAQIKTKKTHFECFLWDITFCFILFFLIFFVK